MQDCSLDACVFPFTLRHEGFQFSSEQRNCHYRRSDGGGDDAAATQRLLPGADRHGRVPSDAGLLPAPPAAPHPPQRLRRDEATTKPQSFLNDGVHSADGLGCVLFCFSTSEFAL